LSGNFASSLNNLCGINWNDPWDYYFNRGNNFNQLWSSFCSGYRKASPNNLAGSGYLEQNSPNPAIGFTTIEYFIPENSKTAELILRDVTGKVVETVEVEKTGTGTIQLATNNLSMGIYAYTLYSDGEMLATKRMVVGNAK